MAKTISHSCGCKEMKTTVKSSKPKKLSKAGEWLEAHPGGICKILDMKAVMK